MATDDKSKETKVSNGGDEKVDPVAGSPITIGGGSGMETERFVDFDPRFWHCDCEAGRLTLKSGTGKITSIDVIRHGTSGPISPLGVTAIRVEFD